MTLKDTLIGLLIIIIWGINFVVIVWGLDKIPPLLMGAGRFILIAAIGSLFVKRPDIPWRWLALYGLTLGFGQFALLFSAMAMGMPAGLASLVLQSQGIFTLIFAALLLKEVIKPVQVFAMLIAGFGLYVIGSAQQATLMTGIGFGLTLAAAMCWGLGNIVNRSISERGFKANIGLVVWSSWVPPIPFLLMSYWFEGSEVISASVLNFSLSAFAALCYLSFAASLVGYSLWSYLLQRYPASQVAPLTLGVPVVGLTAAAFFLDESINWQQGLGIAIVLIGLLINAMGAQLWQTLARSWSAKPGITKN